MTKDIFKSHVGCFGYASKRMVLKNDDELLAIKAAFVSHSESLDDHTGRVFTDSLGLLGVYKVIKQIIDLVLPPSLRWIDAACLW